MVDIWHVSVDQSPDVLGNLFERLSPDEILKAGRFRREDDRRRFVIARGALRTILGKRLRAPPESIQFGYGPSGKPFLACPKQTGRGALHFNVSHSGMLVLIAAVRGRAVGVDVEHIDGAQSARGAIGLYASAAEQAV